MGQSYFIKKPYPNWIVNEFKIFLISAKFITKYYKNGALIMIMIDNIQWNSTFRESSGKGMICPACTRLQNAVKGRLN